VLRPNHVPGGAIVFTVANRTTAMRTFGVAGKVTPRIPPGKIVTLRAALPVGGDYLAEAYGARQSNLLSSGLTVTVPCSHAVDSTVTVQMQEAPIRLSAATVPCGTVTYDITNVGTVAHAFEILQPGTPGTVAGVGPLLEPGHVATLRVEFKLTGRAAYFCSVPEHDDEYGETGVFLTVK
jgi:hypothetical protein